jgi:hypothetical protein
VVYIPDLELCQYHPGPLDSAEWAAPLKAIGWLEHPEPFNTGAVPDELIPRLKAIIDKTRTVYSQYKFRGIQRCSICEFAGLPSPGPIWSPENIFVPGQDAVYAAPGGIVHYIEEHSYLPPPEFVKAVLRCPDCGTDEYLKALRKANRETDPPLVDYETDHRRYSERVKEILAVSKGKNH